MRRFGLVLFIVLLACSNLTEGEGGVAALEIVAPDPPEIAVGQTVQLTARAFDRDGNEVAAEVAWRTPDATLSVEETTGRVTGLAAGTGRVQATAGSFASATVTFTVVEPTSAATFVMARAPRAQSNLHD